jgi:SulP family sulfate permease
MRRSPTPSFADEGADSPMTERPSDPATNDDGASPANPAPDGAIAADAAPDGLIADAPLDASENDAASLGTTALRRVVEVVEEVGPRPATLRDDAIAGLVGAIGSVPDGMAGAVLAGVNPIFGLYASAVGPIVGGLLVATPLMVVTSTSAAALASGTSVAGFTGDDRASALFLLVLVAGIFQFAVGAARLGRLTHFVSHSVMVGFLTGVATLIVLGQLGSITGTSPTGPNNVAKAIDVVLHPSDIQLVSLILGTIAIAVTVAPLGSVYRKVAPLLAIAIPSLIVAVLSLDTVKTVSDVGAIPRGFSTPQLPPLGLLSVDLITGAISVGAIILVQGAGVAESLPVETAKPNPNRASRDFIAQGAANVATGLFQGVPVGGSVSQTALRVSAGARSRWATILSGLLLIVILFLFGPVVELVPMPALAGLLIVAGLNTINLAEASAIWRTGLVSRIAIVTTFVATLFLPIQFAVGIGVVLSTLLYLNQASTDVSVVELVSHDGVVEERKPGPVLQSERPTVLDIYGSVFYAGARTFARLLPAPEGSVRPVVVLRLRGRTKVGSTFIDVLSRYAARIGAVGGRLYLTGVDDQARQQFIRSGKLDIGGTVWLEAATPVLGESTRLAVDEATMWLTSASAAGEAAPD